MPSFLCCFFCAVIVHIIILLFRDRGDNDVIILEPPHLPEGDTVGVNSGKPENGGEATCGEPEPQQCCLDNLLSMFAGKLRPKQVICVYRLSKDDFDSAMDCLVEGPTIGSLLKLQNAQYGDMPATKLYVDPHDMWADTVAFYKSHRLNLDKAIRVVLNDQPAVDTGGVRRQVFTDVFQQFAENKHAQLFDGPPNSLRPRYTAESRSSGLFKVLGRMVSHAIAQDGVGFPYLSLACFWYIAAGEDQALQFVGLSDVGADVAHLVTQVTKGIINDEYLSEHQLVSQFPIMVFCVHFIYSLSPLPQTHTHAYVHTYIIL